MALDITLAQVEPCAACKGPQWLRLEREREGDFVQERPVLACWNGHRSYL